jgi:integrase-like protein
MRNYSPKTVAGYRLWMRKFQSFVRSKPAHELDSEDAKAFLRDLAGEHCVAASTQNQAFNVLLFFYRHVLRREFGKLDGVVRALWGAGLNVADPEPLPAGHPLWSARDTAHGRRVTVFCENLRRMQAGQPLLALIDKRRGY